MIKKIRFLLSSKYSHFFFLIVLAIYSFKYLDEFHPVLIIITIEAQIVPPWTGGDFSVSLWRYFDTTLIDF